MEQERVNVYITTPSADDMSLSHYTLNDQGEVILETLTVWLPRRFRVEETDGKRHIVCPNGTIAGDVQGNYKNSGKPYIEHLSPVSKKKIRNFCSILSSASRMCVKAYRKFAQTQKTPIWSLTPLENAEEIELYLPEYCKLIQDERAGLVIQIPTTNKYEKVTFEDGSTEVIEELDIVHAAFSGVGKPGHLPFLTVGTQYRSCYIADPDRDIYAPPQEGTIMGTRRMADGTWAVDTYRSTGPHTGILLRSYHTKRPTHTFPSITSK